MANFFSEAGAQAHRDGQLNAYLASEDAADYLDEHITELVNGIRLTDTVRVAELIIDNDPSWACDAIAHAMATGDWLFVKNQAEKHVIPLIKEAAEADAAKEARQAFDDEGEARAEALADARDGW